MGSGNAHERPERKPRGPRVEHKPKAEAEAGAKHEPKRDPTLPEGLAFKPFNALVGEPPKPPESIPQDSSPETAASSV